MGGFYLFHLIAYVIGLIEQQILLRNEYLAAENRILRRHIRGQLRLNDGERMVLARIARKLGKDALKDVASIFTPDTILGWYRKLIARKFDGSKKRKGPGRPSTAPQTVKLILRLARENKSWGYDKIADAVVNLGIEMTDTTVENILKKHGIVPAPERKKKTTWKEFIKAHLDVLGACDFFTVEAWSSVGFVTYYVLFFIKIDTREVHIAGITPYPYEEWMKQVARNLTMADWGFLNDRKYLILDGDKKFTKSFKAILKGSGVDPVKIPRKSPNLNAFAERFVLSIKTECLSRLMLFGEKSVRKAIDQYVEHYTHERNHQGRDHEILFPNDADRIGSKDGKIEKRSRLGGLLNFYHRRAA